MAEDKKDPKIETVENDDDMPDLEPAATAGDEGVDPCTSLANDLHGACENRARLPVLPSSFPTLFPPSPDSSSWQQSNFEYMSSLISFYVFRSALQT